MLGISYATILKLIRSQELPTVKVMRHYLIEKSALEMFLQQNTSAKRN